jgi:DNA-binding response OmpR family regulator
MTKILVAEHKPELAAVIQGALEAAGYQAVHAADTLTTVELAVREAPALIILDWALPDLNGLEVLRQLRLSTRTPVLMLAARGVEPDRVIGFAGGADDYLAQPFSLRELTARVDALVRRRRADPNGSETI